MQIQTTTITTETQNAGGVNFQITVYEPSKIISAFCDCCSNQATGTKEQLKQRGWGFWNGSEFCPFCN